MAKLKGVLENRRLFPNKVLIDALKELGMGLGMANSTLYSMVKHELMMRHGCFSKVQPTPRKRR